MWGFLVLLGIAQTAGLGGVSDADSCLNELEGEEVCRAGERSVLSPSCEGKVELKDIQELELGKDNIFFVETSPKEVITPREGCAVESAVRNSGLSVVVVRVGQELDLSDNTTCQVYHGFRDKVTFLRVDLDSLARGTHIEGFFSSQRLRESMSKYVHTADALRLLLIEKYGGFYSDSDFVILKSLVGLENVIASDQVNEEKYSPNGQLLVGDTVTNAMFHFSKGAKILKMSLQNFNNMFKSQVWASGGPDLLQRSLLFICGVDKKIGLREIQMTRERFSPEHCGGIQVLDSRAFYPFSWMQSSQLYDPKRSRKEWYSQFTHSYAVHFYHSSSQSSSGPQTIRRPKYYGARKPAYLALALDHCPVSYRSRETF